MGRRGKSLEGGGAHKLETNRKGRGGRGKGEGTRGGGLGSRMDPNCFAEGFLAHKEAECCPVVDRSQSFPSFAARSAVPCNGHRCRTCLCGLPYWQTRRAVPALRTCRVLQRLLALAAPGRLSLLQRGNPGLPCVPESTAFLDLRAIRHQVLHPKNQETRNHPSSFGRLNAILALCGLSVCVYVCMYVYIYIYMYIYTYT